MKKIYVNSLALCATLLIMQAPVYASESELYDDESFTFNDDIAETQTTDQILAEGEIDIRRGINRPAKFYNLVILNNAKIKETLSTQGNFTAGTTKPLCYNASTGCLGIGTANPKTKLDVRGNTNIKNDLVVGNNVTISTMDSGVVCSQDGKLIVQTVQKGELADNSVGTFELIDLSVINEKIATGTISIDKLKQPLDGNLSIVGNLVFNESFNAVGSSSEVGLHIVRGSVDASGTVVSGSGFSVSVGSTGVYNITFDNGFAGASSYLIIAIPTTSVNRRLSTANISATQTIISTFTDAGTAVDQAFNFIAIGS